MNTLNRNNVKRIREWINNHKATSSKVKASIHKDGLKLHAPKLFTTLPNGEFIIKHGRTFYDIAFTIWESDLMNTCELINDVNIYQSDDVIEAIEKILIKEIN